MALTEQDVVVAATSALGIADASGAIALALYIMDVVCTGNTRPQCRSNRHQKNANTHACLQLLSASPARPFET